MSKTILGANALRKITRSHVARTKHREIFFAANGFGPYECYLCGEYVYFLEVEVHHANFMSSDNTPENLVAIHHSCHTSLTQKYAWICNPNRKRRGKSKGKQI